MRITLSIIILAFALLLSSLIVIGMADPPPPDGDSCCSKCSSCDPEFSPVTSFVAFLGIGAIAFFVRHRLNHE